MIIFLTGCFVGYVVTLVVVCLLAMAGRKDDENENKEKES